MVGLAVASLGLLVLILSAPLMPLLWEANGDFGDSRPTLTGHREPAGLSRSSWLDLSRGVRLSREGQQGQDTPLHSPEESFCLPLPSTNPAGSLPQTGPSTSPSFT